MTESFSLLRKPLSIVTRLIATGVQALLALAGEACTPASAKVGAHGTPYSGFCFLI